MRLREKAVALIVIGVSLFLTYTLVWPILAFFLKAVFYTTLTLLWLIPLGTWVFYKYWVWKNSDK